MPFINPLRQDIYVSRQNDRGDDIRGPYFRDMTAILHSMPFRRLKHKTQVFFAPQNDHLCTRIEHVMHVATIAVTICKQLDLDTDLAQAIGMGHDLGHAPFGHAGEESLTSLSKTYGFIHELNSLRVVDKLTNGGKGLNITYAVRDGIVSHCGETKDRVIYISDKEKKLEDLKDRASYPTSYEGCVVRLSDSIAYMGRDIEDALTVGLITEDQIPKNIKQILGNKNGEIVNSLVSDVIKWSSDNGQIGFSEDMFALWEELRNFNYKQIYEHSWLVNYKGHIRIMITSLFEHIAELVSKNTNDFDKYPIRIPMDKHLIDYLKELNGLYELEGFHPERVAIDFISGMTDRYALRCYQDLYTF